MLSCISLKVYTKYYTLSKNKSIRGPKLVHEQIYLVHYIQYQKKSQQNSEGIETLQMLITWYNSLKPVQNNIRIYTKNY